MATPLHVELAQSLQINAFQQVVKTEQNKNSHLMLRYALIFLIVAIIAGFLGFSSLSGTAAWIAKVLLVVFLVLFVVSLLRGKK